MFSHDTTHSERVEQTAAMFEESEFHWDVTRLNNRFSADLIVQKKDVYPEPEFALVVSSGNLASAMRKMNFFTGTDYYWALVSHRSEMDHMEREWMRGLGVAWVGSVNGRRELVVTFSSNDAKLPIDYTEFEYDTEERLETLGWDPSCLEQLEKKYAANTRAFLKGDGDPKTDDKTTFNLRA